MDDDDYYPQDRISHAVKKLQTNPRALCAGSSIVYIYFNDLEKIYQLNIDKNSIILVMSDHGISVGEKIGERAYGAFCYDYTLRTFSYFLIPNYLFTTMQTFTS